MATNIENEEIKYASSFKRFSAISIDIIIVAFLRIFFAQIIGNIWVNKVIINFLSDFKNYFGTEVVKNNPEHIKFITQHEIFYTVIIFYILIIMVGALYHAYLNSSNWQGTIGKRLMKIIIVNENNHKKINFFLALGHYFLSILPIAYIIYLLIFQVANNLSLFDAITHNSINLILGVIFILWIQIQSLTKKKTTAYDLICETVVIQGKTASKFPWRIS